MDVQVAEVNRLLEVAARLDAGEGLESVVITGPSVDPDKIVEREVCITLRGRAEDVAAFLNTVRIEHHRVKLESAVGIEVNGLIHRWNESVLSVRMVEW